MLKIVNFLRLWCALCVGVVSIVADLGAVFADTCNPGEYMVCYLDPQYNSECTDCGCATCPSGQTSDGTGYVSYCPNQSGSSGCYTPTDLCPGYGTCPSGVGGSDKKCKEVSGCTTSGCQKYAICNPSNGAITYAVSGSCHLEGSSCYSNTVPCSTFSIDHFAVGWNCDQGAQVNNATWNASRNAWDTKNCTCSVVDRDIVHDVGGVAAGVHCIKANADFYVADADRYKTTNIDGAVHYSFLHEFCRQCEPGYLPYIVSSPSDGIILRPANSSGNWGTYKCTTVVTAPYYADGCIINFNLPTGAAAIDDSGCKKTCAPGLIIDEDGATSANQCVMDPNQRFYDNTGSFIIGAGQCSTGG